MAVVRIATPGANPHYLGGSGDRKPDGVAAGSVFLETDTGAVYRYDGDRVWWPEQAPVGAALMVAVLREMLELLAEVRDEVRAARLGVQERLNEGNAQQHDLLEMAQSIRDSAEEA